MVAWLVEHAAHALAVLVGSVLLAAGVVFVDDGQRSVVRGGAWVAGLTGIALHATVLTDLFGWTSIWT